MAVKELTETQSKMSLRLNLDELFDVDFTGKIDLKERIAQRVVETILDRTSKGFDINGSRFPGYSDSYKKSLAFKAFNKGRTVNLELTGQMLGTMEVLDTTGSQIELGWSDDLETAKAFNHNIGDTLPRRRFFDISSEEIESIRNEFESEIEQEFSPRAQTIRILDQLSRPNLPEFDFDIGDEDGV